MNTLRPIFTSIDPTYRKETVDVWVLNFDDIPVDAKLIYDRQIVQLGPGSVGGNHKHPRTEWFVAMGDLVLVWQDEVGDTHQQHMNPNDQLYLVEVPSLLPHAVVNRSKTQFGVLYEMGDGKMKDVQKVAISSSTISI